jgi:hypothetical protein
MSRGRLVAKDRSSGRRSPMKAGNGTVQAKSSTVRRLLITVGGQGRRGEGSGGGSAGERKTGETRDDIG